MNKLLLAFSAPLLATGLLISCAPTVQSTQPILLDAQPTADGDKKWAKYDAYYLIDECFLEFDHPNSLLNFEEGKRIINKKIKIITTQGARFGTVELPFYSSKPTVFRLAEWDSAGNAIPLPTESIRLGWETIYGLVRSTLMEADDLDDSAADLAA